MFLPCKQNHAKKWPSALLSLLVKVVVEQPPKLGQKEILERQTILSKSCAVTQVKQ